MKVHGNHKAHFLAGEGDRWFERNRDHIVSPADWLRDPVLVLLKQLDRRLGLSQIFLLKKSRRVNREMKNIKICEKVT